MEPNPKPKGSKRSIGKGRMIEEVEGSEEWEKLVSEKTAKEIAKHTEKCWPISDKPVAVCFDFRVTKPKSYTTKKETWPIKRISGSGDWDKLARNVSDGISERRRSGLLISSGVIRDDSQIVWGLVTKKWATPEMPAGCTIEIFTPIN